MKTLTLNMFAETNEDLPIISGFALTQAAEMPAPVTILTSILIDYKALSPSTVDLVLDIAEYSKSVEECWRRLDSLLARDRITQATYNEIKSQVTFFEN